MNDQTKPELFDIVGFAPDESYDTMAANVEAEAGVLQFRSLMASLPAQAGTMTRLIMVDKEDRTVMEWIRDQGLVFPPPPEGHEPVYKY